uniref:Helitron helicase-like domain-containing protein n=1 Tax=Schizaphis graminum TaxID=13262 RepID=A0A2S2NWE4_SCHGA
MVRQEGQPTLFLTFSPRESIWTDLLKILYKLRYSKTLSDDTVLTYAQKSDLIRQDPVVCATYFDHRFRELFKLIKSKNVIFKEHSVKHFFYRVEYQHRGSPHAIVVRQCTCFDPAKSETFGACVTLINKYITCMVDDGSPAHEYLHKNTQSHTHTCYRTDKDKQMKKCRFNISYPPMNETRILTPLTEDISNPITRKIRTLQYEKLLQYLRDFKDSDSSSDPSLEDILQKLSIKDVNEYKSIIRTVIRRPTVFLKRTIKQRMISGFNEELFPLWQSNMDIQFILDVYSCVRYVIEYIGKSQRGISKLIRDIVENLKSSTDLSVKEQLKKIASTFSGSQEISAQEAVYTCTGMKQCNTSTGYIFINTSHPDKRTRMLKPMAVRGEMDPKSDDIFFDGLIEYYSCRPYSLKDVTLAEFGSNYEVRGKKKNRLTTVLILTLIMNLIPLIRLTAL